MTTKTNETSVVQQDVAANEPANHPSLFRWADKTESLVGISTSVIALVFSLIAFFRSFPPDSRIELAAGHSMYLYHHVSNSMLKDHRDSSLRLRLPITIINSGGEAATLEYIRLVMQDESDNKNTLLFYWNSIAKFDNADFQFDDFVAPIHLNGNSSISKLIVFTGGDISKHWIAKPGKYKLQFSVKNTEDTKEKVVLEFVTEISESNAEKLEIEKVSRFSQMGIWLHPLNTKVIE